MRNVFRGQDVWATVTLALLAATSAMGEDAASQELKMQPGPAPQANFQPYIFWAYGLACAFLFLFTLFTLAQARRTRARLEYLEERLDRVYPGSAPTTTP